MIEIFGRLRDLTQLSNKELENTITSLMLQLLGYLNNPALDYNDFKHFKESGREGFQKLLHRNGIVGLAFRALEEITSRPETWRRPYYLCLDESEDLADGSKGITISINDFRELSKALPSREIPKERTIRVSAEGLELRLSILTPEDGKEIREFHACSFTMDRGTPHEGLDIAFTLESG